MEVRDSPYIPSPCPTCGQKKRAPKTEPTEKARPKQRVRIDVPDDDEDGSEVFHTLLVACADQAGRGEPSRAIDKYFVLVEVMQFFLTSPKQRQDAA
jgi:hypothetical protein